MIFALQDGSMWMRFAKNQMPWRPICEPYVQLWTVKLSYNDDDYTYPAQG